MNKLIGDYQPPKINPPEQKGATSVVIHCSNDSPVEPKTEWGTALEKARQGKEPRHSEIDDLFVCEGYCY